MGRGNRAFLPLGRALDPCPGSAPPLKAALDADRSSKSTTVTDDTGIIQELVLAGGQLSTRTEEPKFVIRASCERVLLIQRPEYAVKRFIILAVALPWPRPQASAQTDARLQAAVQLAAEGLPDSATAIVNGLLAVTPATDPLYPQILYTQGSIARSTTEMQRAFQKVAVEYPDQRVGRRRPAPTGADGFCRPQLCRDAVRGGWSSSGPTTPRVR